MSTIAVSCPNCKKNYRLPRALEGNRIKCKSCETKFRVASADPGPTLVQPPPRNDDTEQAKVVGNPSSQAESAERPSAPPSGDVAIHDNLGNIRAVFWIVPLYALAIGFFVTAIAFSNYDSIFSVLGKVRHPAAYKFIGIAAALFIVGLVGVAIRSIECASIIGTDPLRAFAMGRYILVLYLLVSFPLYVISQWPSATIEAPLDAVVDYNESLVVIAANQAMVFEPTGWWWLFYFTDIACEFFSTFCLVAFSFATYRMLLKDKREYEIDHFIFDITFGWKGRRY